MNGLLAAFTRLGFSMGTLIRFMRRFLSLLYRFNLRFNEVTLSIRRRVFSAIFKIIFALASFFLLSHLLTEFSAPTEEPLQTLATSKSGEPATSASHRSGGVESFQPASKESAQNGMLFMAASMFLMFGLTISACDFLRSRRGYHKTYRRLARYQR